MTVEDFSNAVQPHASRADQYDGMISSESLVDYTQLFGMSQPPFDKGAGGFFGAHGRQSLAAQLLHLLHFSDSLSLLTGDRGTGKTTFANYLKSQLSDQDYVFFDSGTELEGSRHLLYRLAETIGLAVSSEDSLARLQARLKEWNEFSGGSLQVYILIDDADALSKETLLTLIDLARAGDAGSCWHILLLGQPNLADAVLALPSIDDERPQAFSMPEISQEFVADYLAFRLSEAGYEGDNPFTEADEESIWITSSGDLNSVNTNAEISMLERAAVPSREAIKVPWLHLSALFALALILVVAWWGYEREDISESITIALPTSQMTSSTEFDGVSGSPSSDLDESVVQSPKTLVVQDSSVLASQPVSPVPDPLMVSGSFSANSAEINNVAATPKIPSAEPATEKLPSYSNDETALLALNPEHFTLQVLAAESKSGVEAFIRANSTAPLRSYQTKRAGKPWYVVVLGDYPSAEDAKRATQKLPKNLQKAGPWPRKLASVQQQIKES